MEKMLLSFPLSPRQRDFNDFLSGLAEDCRQVTGAGLEPIDVRRVLMQAKRTDRT